MLLSVVTQKDAIRFDLFFRHAFTYEFPCSGFE